MRPLHILLVEDDNDDIELLQDALEENKVPNQMQVIKDGGAVFAHLKTIQQVPDIIVMDFNLPKIHGREVLKNIRNSALFKNVPILILTTSSSPADMDYAYKEGASKYLIKPTTTAGFRDVALAINELVVA